MVNRRKLRHDINQVIETSHTIEALLVQIYNNELILDFNLYRSLSARLENLRLQIGDNLIDLQEIEEDKQ